MKPPATDTTLPSNPTVAYPPLAKKRIANCDIWCQSNSGFQSGHPLDCPATRQDRATREYAPVRARRQSKDRSDQSLLEPRLAASACRALQKTLRPSAGVGSINQPWPAAFQSM